MMSARYFSVSYSGRYWKLSDIFFLQGRVLLYLLFALRGINVAIEFMLKVKGNLMASTAEELSLRGVQRCIPTAWSSSRRACPDLPYACDTAGSQCSSV